MITNFYEALKRRHRTFSANRLYGCQMLVQSKSLIDAQNCNGVKHMCTWAHSRGIMTLYSTVFRLHQMIEAYLRDSGVAWTNLHPNMFMQSFLSVWSIKGAVYMHTLPKPLGLLLWKT